jgi:hypothetical protein
VLGVTELAGMNSMLAAFVAGVVFNFSGCSDVKEQQKDAQEAITRFFDLPIFVLLVIALLRAGRLDLGWAVCSWLQRCSCSGVCRRCWPWGPCSGAAADLGICFA